VNRASDLLDTFLSVARCPNVRICLESDVFHPCREIVESQRSGGVQTYPDFQIPEPWVRELDHARILFISSNPSIGDDNHAVGSLTDEVLWESHHLAFGCGSRPHILDGINTTTAIGQRFNFTRPLGVQISRAVSRRLSREVWCRYLREGSPALFIRVQFLNAA
jgi:hypothetical protein